MKFVKFSKKQKMVLTWWQETSPVHDKDAIICDGSVRAGNTIIMSLSYVMWAMSTFKGQNLLLCGKTIASTMRNVWIPLSSILKGRGYTISKVPDLHDAYRIRKGKVQNDFYIFGGKDERSQVLVQGITAAGAFFDEVALQPQSFVNQALARCSVKGAKFWFNCNPESPYHWFKLEWIDKRKEMNAVHIHFRLEDNPSLDEETIARYYRMYSGVFFERFILGLWVLAEGIVYSMFKKEYVIDKIPPGVRILKKWIGCDYGQSNATVFLLCGLGSDNKLYILDEYYHSGRQSVIQKSPAKYSRDYHKWKIKNGVDGVPVNVEKTFIDPSAKGFMLQLHEDGENRVWPADNEVLKGIETVSSIIDCDMLRVLSHCKHTINEFVTYRWDPKKQEIGEDVVIKDNDHCMDALRYVVNGTRKIWQHNLMQYDKRSMTDINKLKNEQLA